MTWSSPKSDPEANFLNLENRSLTVFRLSLKRGFGGCGHGLDGCDGIGGFDGLGGFGGFDGFSGFGRFDGFSGFDG